MKELRPDMAMVIAMAVRRVVRVADGYHTGMAVEGAGRAAQPNFDSKRNQT